LVIVTRGFEQVCYEVHQTIRITGVAHRINGGKLLFNQLAAEVSRQLEDRVGQGQFKDMGELSSTIVSWITYEKGIQEAPTWPFNAGIARRLAMSILMPGVVYLLKIIGQYWARFGF